MALFQFVSKAETVVGCVVRVVFLGEVYGTIIDSRDSRDDGGFVTPDEALEITARGLVGLSPLLDTPNYNASLPTKILEYLAVGLPTVASDLPGTRAIVGGKPGVILVPPGDVSAWAKAVAGAVVDEELRRQASENAATIKEAFVWPGDAVRKHYRSLL